MKTRKKEKEKMLFTKSIFSSFSNDLSWKIYIPTPTLNDERKRTILPSSGIDEFLRELMPNPASWRAFQEGKLSWESFEELYRYQILTTVESEKTVSLIVSHAQFYPVVILDCFPEMETEFSLRGVLAGVCKRWTKELDVVSG